MTKKEKLKRAIMKILESGNYRGWGSGIKKDCLLEEVRKTYRDNFYGYIYKMRFSPHIERSIRLAIASMPEVANCGNGYYLIETAEDLKKEEEMLINQYIIPLATKIRDKRAAHPELFPSPAQMSIWGEDFWDHIMMREGEIKKRKKGES